MVNALKLAKKFHDTYEELAPSFGYVTNTDTRLFNPESNNGRLMLAVCQKIGDELEKEAFNAGFERGIHEKYEG